MRRIAGPWRCCSCRSGAAAAGVRGLALAGNLEAPLSRRISYRLACFLPLLAFPLPAAWTPAPYLHAETDGAAYLNPILIWGALDVRRPLQRTNAAELVCCIADDLDWLYLRFPERR